MHQKDRRICFRIITIILCVMMVFSVADVGTVARAAVNSSTSTNSAKTYTLSDVDSLLAKVANTGAYTINGADYKATSMQGLNVGTTYAYTAKTESTTGVNGSEAMTCMWRVKLSDGSKVRCVFKNEGASSYIEYSTALGHANDILVRKYLVGTDAEETNNIFACTLNSGRGIVRLKSAGTDSSGRVQLDFGGFYKMVYSSGTAFAPAGMRYITEYTDPASGKSYSYFLCKDGMDFSICRIAFDDEGGPQSSPSVVTCYKLFTIDTHNAYFADADGSGNPGTIDQLQNWTNQQFYYNSTEASIYVPLYNSDTTHQSVILVYDMTGRLTESSLTAQLEAGVDVSSVVFPSMLTFNVIDSVKFEIEAVGFATGTQTSYPLYFNTNSTTAKEGIWTFDYSRGSETPYIRQSILDNSDGTQKIYYTVHYDANGGTQDTSVPPRKYMKDTFYVRGVTTELCENTFAKPGYTFAGWNLTRESDGKTLYFVPTVEEDGSTTIYKRWYTAGQQPDGATIALYSDCQNVSSLSAVNGDVVTCTAQWTAS